MLSQLPRFAGRAFVSTRKGGRRSGTVYCTWSSSELFSTCNYPHVRHQLRAGTALCRNFPSTINYCKGELKFNEVMGLKVAASKRGSEFQCTRSGSSSCGYKYLWKQRVLIWCCHVHIEGTIPLFSSMISLRIYLDGFCQCQSLAPQVWITFLCLESDKGASRWILWHFVRTCFRDCGIGAVTGRIESVVLVEFRQILVLWGWRLDAQGICEAKNRNSVPSKYFKQRNNQAGAEGCSENSFCWMQLWGNKKCVHPRWFLPHVLRDFRNVFVANKIRNSPKLFLVPWPLPVPFAQF